MTNKKRVTINEILGIMQRNDISPYDIINVILSEDIEALLKDPALVKLLSSPLPDLDLKVKN